MKMRKRIDIETRYPVWSALSELFLDTELQESDYKGIANIILQSKYTPHEIHEILWEEVFPVVSVNFSTVIGEWTYFDESWLKEKIVNYIAGIEKGYQGNGFISINRAREIIMSQWSFICKHLPKEYASENKNA